MSIKSLPFRLLQRRAYTALSYHKYSIQSSTDSPILICHGLFGSKQNWSSLGKALSSRLHRDVYTIDLRNHGASPHHPVHTYKAMAEDVIQFMQSQQLHDPILIGHSMGGKVIMATALQHANQVSKVISVDMPPVAIQLASDFERYIKAMKAVEEARPKRQMEADEILKEFVPDIDIRMFLLTNLKRDPHDKEGVMRFRIPYDILGQSLGEISGFDVILKDEGGHYEGPTLFIAGGNSPYLKPFTEKESEIKALFPNSKLDIIENAGHWVHAEKPEQVLSSIISFIKE
ncbi:Alpha/Beta hydrolase protein [Cokeromyces recurvatus]|uniref:Alpha/Beta hydrolase protein n=1 Tax=Cokeromyces recurvatus TaxID=90255 RepID=UPI00221EE051|nr:Alpha/Beta hydrolase protein [Cokeromyces recurvatus]KAI7899015.1 Alpha/Beta hydrolase protein [Cokeromyces recurvatus]